MSNIEKLKNLVGMVGKNPYEGMSPEERKLSKVKEIFALMDQNVTKEDFTKAFDVLTQFVLKIEKRSSDAIGGMEKTYASVLGSIEDVRRDMQAMMRDYEAKMTKDHEAKMRAVDEKMRTVVSGKDADEESIVQEVLRKIPPQKEFTPESTIATRDKLESLEDGEKISIQAIQDLSAILEELKARPTGTVYGGLISKRIRFIDDETPTGTVNGVNTAFTLSKTPETGSLKVYRGGARQRVTEDYTFDGNKTITFTVAPQVGEILLVDFRY